MTWRCALIQRRLPDYPDGDLSPFWKRLTTAHLKVCPECRRELEELTETMHLYQAHPLPDPGEDFWQEFQRELHL
jgi:predicted anti-sigma-YlaC factor YlaD